MPELRTVILVLLLTAVIGLQSGSAYAASITVTSDKNMYAKGETINISGLLTNGGAPVVGADVAVEIKNSLDVEVFEQQLVTDDSGAFTTSIVIPTSWQTGLYTIHAAYQSDRATGYFYVNYGMLRAYSDPAVPTTLIVNNTRRDDYGLNWVKLTPGSYEVHFTDVPGFASPANQTIAVTAGDTTTAAGTFTQLGYLHVVTDPPVAATISIDGMPRNDWGVWLPLTPGLHTVHFGDVKDFATPPDQQVTAIAGQSVTVTGNYVPGTNAGPSGFGLLRVTTSPAVVSSIYVNNVLMNDWGIDWVKLAPGAYTIHFTDVPGFLSPNNQIMIVTAGEITEATGLFTPLGYLRVITNPSVAGTIYANGAAMDDWGVWVAVQPGSYTVSFGDVPAFTKPANQIAVVTAGSTTTVTGEYA